MAETISGSYRQRLEEVRVDLIGITERINNITDKVHGAQPRPADPTTPTPPSAAAPAVGEVTGYLENWVKNVHSALDRLEKDL